MINLLEETKETLESNGKTIDNLTAVIFGKYRITVENFISVADVEYDNGFGAPQVGENLVVMGDGFWLERHEYDGSEWWEYKESIPTKDLIEVEIDAVTISQAEELGRDVSCGWESVEAISGLKDR